MKTSKDSEVTLGLMLPQTCCSDLSNECRESNEKILEMEKVI